MCVSMYRCGVCAGVEHVQVWSMCWCGACAGVTTEQINTDPCTINSYIVAQVTIAAICGNGYGLWGWWVMVFGGGSLGVVVHGLWGWWFMVFGGGGSWSLGVVVVQLVCLRII